MTTTDQHLNTGSMALDALPEDEAAAFSLHLETCPTCSAELTSFLETAAILGSSVAQAPPASLRRSVMQAIAVTPQLPPLTAPVSTIGPPLGRHRQDDAGQPVDGSTPDDTDGAQPTG
jgi:anti-sigma factor RsiW